MPIALIVLAAGQGTRMNSDLPKVLHKIGGAPMFVHALESARDLAPERVILITGHGAEAVEDAAKAYDEDLICVRQDEQLGTGHAVLQAHGALKDFDGDILVLFGDTPFLTAGTLDNLVAARTSADVIVLGFEASPDTRYGRFITDGERLKKITEWKDATESERAITLCNSGVLLADRARLFELLSKVEPNNAQGEIYLTDVVELANAQRLTVGFTTCDESETLGINTRAELARAETLFQARKRAEMLENGVTLLNPDSVIFAYDTAIGRDAIVEANVVFGPGVTIESNAVIRAFSHLEDCHVGDSAVIGPFARLRPGAEISDDAHIGNFCEIKNAQVGVGAKINHLSYIGDADIGEKTNIGAGTITCNYDGVNKHRTIIGANAFIGSDTMLVAPVKIGDRAMTGSGSVITKDVPAGDLALGRAQQVNKPGYGAKLMDMLRAAKAKRGK